MSQELVDRLRNFEDSWVERKPASANRQDIRQAACAFANALPGDSRPAVLFIGVRDNGDIEGVPDPDAVQKKVREACAEDCYPPIPFRSEVLIENGKPVVAVVVPPSTARPHFTGPAYVRQGSQSIKASEAVFNELIAARNSKTCEILKWKGQQVTFEEPLSRSGFSPNIARRMPGRRSYACVVMGCDAHCVSLQAVDSDRYFSEPLERIMLARDEKNLGRLKLILTPLR